MSSAMTALEFVVDCWVWVGVSIAAAGGLYLLADMTLRALHSIGLAFYGAELFLRALRLAAAECKSKHPDSWFESRRPKRRAESCDDCECEGESECPERQFHP